MERAAYSSKPLTVAGVAQVETRPRQRPVAVAVAVAVITKHGLKLKTSQQPLRFTLVKAETQVRLSTKRETWEFFLSLIRVAEGHWRARYIDRQAQRPLQRQAQTEAMVGAAQAWGQQLWSQAPELK